MSETESDTALKAYLADNPRMIGVLFTILLLLGQAGNAVAGGAHTLTGP